MTTWASTPGLKRRWPASKRAGLSGHASASPTTCCSIRVCGGGNVARVGRQHVRDGVIEIKAEKTGEDLFIPVLPPLAASIATAPTGDLTFVGSDGKPFVKESFGNWFRDACRAAKCPGSAHGLRKAGASTREMMALFGWTNGKMADVYTRAADRKRLARAAAERLVNKNPPHLASGAGRSAKKR